VGGQNILDNERSRAKKKIFPKKRFIDFSFNERKYISNFSIFSPHPNPLPTCGERELE
jgi:hypothetical protein